MVIKLMLFKLLVNIRLFLVNLSYETKRKFLIKQGAKIGKGTRLNNLTSDFGTEPYLVEVGENCLFAKDTYFVTHDGGVKVLNSLHKFEKNMDKIAPIKVGNNVYTGMRSMIMPGVIIGDNVIIGACSVVTHDIPSNSVAVGIPAKVICSLEEYYKRCLPKIEPWLPPKQKKNFYLKKFNENI